MIVPLPWLLGAVAAGAIATGGTYFVQSRTIDALKAEIEELKKSATLQAVQLQSCGGRLESLIRKVRSDAEIDAITDLRDVPDRWLMSEPGDPGVGDD